MLITDIQGLSLEKEDIELLSRPEVSGVILFARNVQSRQQIKELCDAIKTLDPALLITVDQEGGRVQRFKDGFERLPALQAIGRYVENRPEQSVDLCFAMGWLMAAEVISVGVDLSFAPVADLDSDLCTVISDRSISPDPQIASQLLHHYIRGMAEAGMCATLKHYPGHGGVTEDSHEQLPVDNRSLSDFMAKDLQPYRQLLGEYDAVMAAHLLIPDADSQIVGFSRYWLNDVLREQIGFDGVLFSDDLSMSGAEGAGNFAERAQAAVAAGCDLLIQCNDRVGAWQVIGALSRMPEFDMSKTNGKLSRLKARKNHTQAQIQASEQYNRAVKYLSDMAAAGF